MKRLALLMILLILLVGCGGKTLYRKQGANQSDWNKDYWECQMFANQMGAAMSGGTSPGIAGGVSGGFIFAMEYNRHLRDCLRAKGWNPQ